MTATRRFSGVGRLYGDRAQDLFAASHVAIVGIGGVGSWAVEALARTGIGAITLIDLDMIAESNTNRQVHALGDAYGRAKVEAMAERAVQINPSCQVSVIEDFITPENVGELLPPTLSYAVDAVDQTRSKVAIAHWCRQAKIPLVMAGAAGGRRDPTRVRTADLAQTHGDSLLSRVRQQLRKHHDFPREAKREFGIYAVFSEESLTRPDASCNSLQGLSCTGYGSTACVTGAFGFAAASIVLNVLARQRG